jgi:hypothetical protein
LINCKISSLKDRVVRERSEQRILWIKTEIAKGVKTEGELIKEWPEMKNGEELFRYYMTKDSGPDIFTELEKDVTRADLGNTDFIITCGLDGKNALFNVLNAYANYDTEILYSQGMNIVVSWILKFMRIYDPKTKSIVYDECNSFFVMVHIMEVLEYRHIYDETLTKTREILLLL